MEMHQLSVLLKEITDLNKTINQQKALICDKFSPVKIGKIVTVNGYAFTGQKMIVDYVVLSGLHFVKDGRKFEFLALGKVLKKDGTKGKYTGEWYETRA